MSDVTLASVQADAVKTLGLSESGKGAGAPSTVSSYMLKLFTSGFLWRAAPCQVHNFCGSLKYRKVG